MDVFEYISVLTSIIIGLGMTQLLLAVSRIIQHPEKAEPYWVHIGWVIYMFIFAVFWWWWEFNLGRIETWTFGVYLLVILYAFLIFLMCALLSPTDLSGYNGLKGYYWAKRKWIFGTFIIIQIVDVGDAVIKGMDYFYSLGAQYYISQSLIILFSGVAIATRSEKFHAGFVAALLTFMVFQGFLVYDVIQ